MKKIIGFTVNANTLKTSATKLTYLITGEQDAVFSLQVKDNSTPNKFYNFVTNAFTNDITSENTLANVKISGTYNGAIDIPAATGGNTYRFMLFANPSFDTEIDRSVSVDKFFAGINVEQESQVTVRFSTFSEQDNTNLVGIGAFVGSTTGTSNATANVRVDFTETLIDSSTGAHGYKWTAPTGTNPSNSLASNLQPNESDFYVEQRKTTVGSGSSITSMVLDSVDNLAVGMNLFSIASSSVTTSGTLGVLTYPTITAIDISNKTVTLSSAHSWANNKIVSFKAYGSSLITKSSNGIFDFDLTVFPESGHPTSTRTKNWGRATVDGAVSSDSIQITGARGLSTGAKIVGPKVDSADGANVITEVHSSGTPITVAGAQVIADKTLLLIHGASEQGTIEGTITIKKFPSANTDVYFDVDRAFTLSTLN